MSFDTMMASATVSTITIAVAADRPPTKATSVEQFGMRRERQRQHEHVAVDRLGRERQQARNRDRQHEQIDQHEIERKQPRRAADFGLAAVLDHGDMELPRQQHDRERRQHRHGDERATRGARVITVAVCGFSRPRLNSASGPSNITKVTNTPTARKATSLTIDSVAIASISPS